MKPWNSEFSRDAKILLGFGEKVQILANLLFNAKIWAENAKIWKSLKKPKFSIFLWVFFGNIKITTLYHKNYHKYLSKTKGEKAEMARKASNSDTVQRGSYGSEIGGAKHTFGPNFAGAKPTFCPPLTNKNSNFCGGNCPPCQCPPYNALSGYNYTEL